MRYVYLIYQDEDTQSRSEPAAEQITALGHGACVLGDHRLRASHAATTVRTTSGGLVVADGPFTPMCERLSQLWVVEMRDLDDALLAAKGLARSCVGVDIRPIWSAR